MQTLNVEYFRFEEDFMEDNIRCIPMIVRFKLDACGVKLKLNEWGKMNLAERSALAEFPIDSKEELQQYREYLQMLIMQYTGNDATLLAIDLNPEWSVTERVPDAIREKLNEIKSTLSLLQWQCLNNLQRFALLKLTRPGHENRNFPKAMKEFQLL